MKQHATTTECPKCGGIKSARAKTCGNCATKGHKAPSVMVTKQCRACGIDFQLPKWRADQGKGLCCSRVCQNQHQATIRGQAHPKATGRHCPRGSYHGFQWKQARAAALERAGGKCEKCGVDLSTVKRFAVHHKIEAHKFPMVENSHTTDNLTVICQSCHAKSHNLGRIPK